MKILEIKDLHKSFGSLEVISGLNMAIEEDKIYGFLGKNGSGKTTTMRMIVAAARPTAGEIYVCGKKVVFGNTATNKMIGFLPDVPEFYNYMTPKEYLHLCGKLSCMENSSINNRITELLAMVGLDGVNRHIKGFSRGMKQRLGIAQAMLHEPKLLLCDEPTSALDPVGRKEILDILSMLKNKTTIVFSTHILSDVDRICDEIGILHKGKIVLEGNIEEVKEQYAGQSFVLKIFETDKNALLVNELPKAGVIKNAAVKDDCIFLTGANAEKIGKEVTRQLTAQGLSLERFEAVESSLEQVFMEVIGQ